MAAVRPGVLTTPYALVSLVDAMRSLDDDYLVSVGPLRSYVFPFMFHVTSYDICMSHGEPPRLFLCHAYDFSLMLVTHPVRLSRLVFDPDFGTPVLSTRLLPVPVLLTPNLLPDFLPLPDWTLFSFPTFMDLTPVCTCIPVLVYILGWRWDDPHLQSTLQPP